MFAYLRYPYCYCILVEELVLVENFVCIRSLFLDIDSLLVIDLRYNSIAVIRCSIEMIIDLPNLQSI